MVSNLNTKRIPWLVLILTIIILGGVVLLSSFSNSEATIAAGGTSQYDLNSVDSNAWYFLGGSSVPPEPTSGSWIVYTDAYFTDARHQDLLRNAWEGATDDQYTNLLYRFKINEKVNDISQINFGWVGYDELAHGDCLYRYIWNINTSAWDVLGTDCVAHSSDQEYNDIINSDFVNYIDGSGNIYFGIAGGLMGSCPFIYSFDGQNYSMEDEAYSFAILEPWQYESHSLLENLKAVDGKYRIRLTEELPETSMTNRLKLWVVDHPDGTEILPDFDGNLYTISSPIPPKEAIDFTGQDEIQKISKKDNQFWSSNLAEKDLNRLSDLYDGLILTFPVEDKPENAKFILKAKESGFLSFSWSKFLGLIGANNSQFLASLQSDPAWFEKIQNWVMTEAPLQMSIWNGTDWQQIDSLLIGNTRVMQDVLVKIDPALISGDEIKIRLSGPVTAYQIDYATMDYSEELPFEKKEISLSSAQKTSKGEKTDILGQLSAIDDHEILMKMGDSIDLGFDEQPYNWQFLGKIVQEGYMPLIKRSYFLSAHGWYLADINNNADLEKNLPTIERLFSLEEGFSVRYMMGVGEGENHHTMYENYVKTDITQASPSPSPSLPRTGFLSFLSKKPSIPVQPNFWQKMIGFFENIFRKWSF